MKFINTLLFVLLAGTLSPALALAGDIKPYSQAQFDALSAEGKPVLLAVHAGWCPTCKAQKPIVDELMGQPAFKNVTTLIIDFDAEKPLLAKYKVNMQSTLIAFKGAKEVGRTVGDTTRSGIEGLIKKAAN
jgi:thioredoxin 1